MITERKIQRVRRFLNKYGEKSLKEMVSATKIPASEILECVKELKRRKSIR